MIIKQNQTINMKILRNKEKKQNFLRKRCQSKSSNHTIHRQKRVLNKSMMKANQTIKIN